MRETETEFGKAAGNEERCKRFNIITRKELKEELH